MLVVKPELQDILPHAAWSLPYVKQQRKKIIKFDIRRKEK